jgi:hypothetical protein
MKKNVLTLVIIIIGLLVFSNSIFAQSGFDGSNGRNVYDEVNDALKTQKSSSTATRNNPKSKNNSETSVDPAVGVVTGILSGLGDAVGRSTEFSNNGSKYKEEAKIEKNKQAERYIKSGGYVKIPQRYSFSGKQTAEQRQIILDAQKQSPNEIPAQTVSIPIPFMKQQTDAEKNQIMKKARNSKSAYYIVSFINDKGKTMEYYVRSPTEARELKYKIEHKTEFAYEGGSILTDETGVGGVKHQHDNIKSRDVPNRKECKIVEVPPEPAQSAQRQDIQPTQPTQPQPQVQQQNKPQGTQINTLQTSTMVTGGGHTNTSSTLPTKEEEKDKKDEAGDF